MGELCKCEECCLSGVFIHKPGPQGPGLGVSLNLFLWTVQWKAEEDCGKMASGHGQGIPLGLRIILRFLRATFRVGTEKDKVEKPSS